MVFGRVEEIEKITKDGGFQGMIVSNWELLDNCQQIGIRLSSMFKKKELFLLDNIQFDVQFH